MAITGIASQHQDERVVAEELVDSTNPADQYVCVIHPLSGNPVVSVASGTKWQGAA